MIKKLLILAILVLFSTSPALATITGDNGAEFDDGTMWEVYSDSAFGTRSSYSSPGSGDVYMGLGYEDFEDQDEKDDGFNKAADRVGASGVYQTSIDIGSTGTLNNSNYHGIKHTSQIPPANSSQGGNLGLGVSSNPTNDGYFVSMMFKMPAVTNTDGDSQMKIIKNNVGGCCYPEATAGKRYNVGTDLAFIMALDSNYAADHPLRQIRNLGNSTLLDDQQWHQIIWYFEPESSNPANDGIWVEWLDDTLLEDDRAVDSTTKETFMNDYSNGPMMVMHFTKGLGGGQAVFDHLYMDQSGHQVFLGNASTWNNCTRRYPQPLNSWSAGTINFRATVYDFNNSENAWLYVTKDMTPTNTSGYPIVIGQVSGGGGGGDTDRPVETNATPVDGTIEYSLDSDPMFSYTITDETAVDEDSIITDVTADALTFPINNSLSITEVVAGTKFNVSVSNADFKSLFNATITRDLTQGDVFTYTNTAQDTSGNAIVEVPRTVTMETVAPGSQIFSTGDIGDLDNYTLLSDSAIIVVDEMGENMVSIISNDVPVPTDLTLNMTAIYNNEEYRDFEFKFDARYDEPLLTSTLDDMCLIFGYEDPETYYYWMANNNTEYHRIYKVSGGVRTTLMSSNRILINDNDFHEMKLSYYNDVLRVFWGGDKVMQVNEVVIPKGKVGFGSYDQRMSFDNPSLTELTDTLGDDNNTNTRKIYFTDSSVKGTLSDSTKKITMS